MDELKYYNLIEAYFENMLSDQEAKKFEQDLLTNEELKLEYDAYLLTQEASFVLGYERLKKEKLTKVVQIRQKSSSSNRKWWGLAASLILLVGCTMWWANESYSNDAIALNQLADTNVSSSRSSAEPNVLRNIKDAFELGDYNRVIELARRIEETDSIYIESQFIAGHSFIQLGKYANAIPGLKVMSSVTGLDGGNAQWNLALCYVLTNQKEKAIEILDQIASDPKADYYSKAVELKKQLNSFWRNFIL